MRYKKRSPLPNLCQRRRLLNPNLNLKSPLLLLLLNMCLSPKTKMKNLV